MTIQQHASFDSSAAELNATSKLVKAFEAVNSKRAAKGLGMTLMAVSLAACGSDEVVITTPTGDVDVTDLVTDTSTTTLTALQSEASALLSTIAASDIAVEAATLAAGSTAAVLAANEVTVAPATAAAATTAFDVLAAATTAAFAVPGGASGGLEASAGIGLYATTTFATLATMLANDNAVTPAQVTALATADAALSAAFSFEAASDASTLLAAQVAANGAAALTAANAAAANGIAAIGTLVGTNLANVTLTPDTTAATAADNLAGATAFAEALQTAMLANDAAYATAFAAETAANQVLVTDAILADVQANIANGNMTQNANSGAITAVTSVEAEILLAATAVTAAVAALDPDGAEIIDVTTAGGLVDAITDAANDQAADAAFIAAYEGLLASSDLIAAADAPSLIAAIEAGVIATSSLNVDNVDTNGGAGTDGNDVFIFNEANGNMVVGTAATAAAAGNVLFGAGDDSVIIFGEYTFTTIATAAEFAAIGTTAVGDATATEIFVYQNATSGDTVLTIEENAFDGSTTSNTAMTTLTLTDITFTGVDVTSVDGNTILTEVAAVIA